MSEVSARLPDGELIERARAGDPDAFGALVRPLRAELHAHCYRMLGSAHDADDAVQDAWERAWRAIGGYAGSGTVRAWLYTVTTRVCLDAIASRGRRALPMDLGPSSPRAVTDDTPATEVRWLGPYPVEVPPGAATPEARYEQREAVELAFVAALAHLPGNQRAALLLFEVLGFSAAEIAGMLDTSVPAVNSALQRARRIVDAKVPAPSQRHTLAALGDRRLRAIAGEYSSALERGDAEALVALLTEDVTWSMPPLRHWYQGLPAVTDFLVRLPLSSCGRWRHQPTVVNGQLAVASYLRGPDAEEHTPWSVDVLTLRGERIAAVTAFLGTDTFTALGLPASLP